MFSQLSKVKGGLFRRYERQAFNDISKNGPVGVELIFKCGVDGAVPTKILYDLFGNGELLMAKIFSINTDERLGEAVRLTLDNFMGEMYEWEKKYYKKSMEALEDEALEEPLQNHMRADLLSILSRYVDPANRNYDRLENLVCGLNPEYDPENDSVGGVEFKGGVASVIIEKNTGFLTVYRLVFSVEEDGCLIRWRDFKSGGKWNKTYI